MSCLPLLPPNLPTACKNKEIRIYLKNENYTISYVVYDIRVVYDIVYDIALPEASGVFYVLPLLTATEDSEGQARKD